jgi:YHS domain-containing protein
MKTNLLKGVAMGVLFMMLGACTVLKNGPSEYAIDPVCNMKTEKSEAYKWKYEGEKYYFDSYACKESFKMSPKKFLENKCADLKEK